MPVEYSISQLLSFGKLSQVLANVDNQNKLLLQSGNLDPRLPVSIYQVWKPYGTQAANIINKISGGAPVLSGPSNQSVTVGATATFSVVVTGATPINYQWFANGVFIPGANSSSYLVTNAQLTQSGNTYFVAVNTSAGLVVSNTATLTVTESLQGQWYAGSTDYSAQLEAGTDNVPYNGTFNITSGQPLVVPFPAGQVLYVTVKYPTSQTMKTQYANPAGGLDQGTVPGLAFNTNIFGGNNYIFSRTGNALGINNSTGQVTFS
jgi:hypothetical protein